MRAPARYTGPPRLLRVEAIRKERPGGSETVREALGGTAVAYKIIRARDVRWNWLGHVLRMEEHRLVRQVLLTCVKHTSVSILADIPSRDIRAAIRIAADRVEWKRLRPSRRC